MMALLRVSPDVEASNVDLPTMVVSWPWDNSVNRDI